MDIETSGTRPVIEIAENRALVISKDLNAVVKLDGYVIRTKLNGKDLTLPVSQNYDMNRVTITPKSIIIKALPARPAPPQGTLLNG